MNKQFRDSGINFTTPAPNYLLLGISIVILVCLLVGLTVAVYTKETLIISSIYLISAVGVAAFSILHLREAKKFAAGQENQTLDWEVIAAVKQHDKLNKEVLELAKTLEIGSDEMSDLLSAYIVAQDLALRQIQQEAQLPLIRCVSLADVPFDAILIKKELITCIETSFLVTPHIAQEKINLILRKADALKKSVKQLKLQSKIRLLLVLITQLEPQDETELRSVIKQKFAATSVDVDIRLLDFAALQKTYAME